MPTLLTVLSIVALIGRGCASPLCISCSQRPDGAPRLNFPVGVRRAVHMPPQAVARARRGETLPVACIRRPSARRGEQKIRPNRPGRHRRKPQNDSRRRDLAKPRRERKALAEEETRTHS